MGAVGSAPALFSYFCAPHNVTALTLLGRVGDGSPRALSAVPCLALLTTGLDDSKPYVFLKTLDESYNNHIRFTIIRASGEEQ